MKTLKIVGIIVAVLAGLLLIGRAVFVLAGPERSPQQACLQNACAANGVAHIYILGWRNLGTYIGWYDTAYTLAGCRDPDGWTAFQYLLSIASELVGAPGGYPEIAPQMVVYEPLRAGLKSHRILSLRGGRRPTKQSPGRGGDCFAPSGLAMTFPRYKS
ncbi:MAG: hypothetical protein ACP5N6_09940 [Anaerolineae bacterium]